MALYVCLFVRNFFKLALKYSLCNKVNASDLSNHPIKMPCSEQKTVGLLLFGTTAGKRGITLLHAHI